MSRDDDDNRDERERDADDLTDRAQRAQDRYAARFEVKPERGQDRRDRRKAALERTEPPPVMTGWVQPTTGVPVVPPPGVLPLPPGAVVVQAEVTPAGIIVDPDIVVVPGGTYTASATVNGSTGFVGLQWVTVDGLPAGAVWAGGGNGDRVNATGTAPATATGARMILTAYTGPGDQVGVTGDALALLVSLQAWLDTH